MYAIARIAGKQFRIEPDADIKVPKLPLQVGASFEIKEVLFLADGDKTRIGQPALEGVKATSRVVSHGRDPKIIVFKKKRRKGFQVKKGHRQAYTLLHIEKILVVTTAAKPAPKAKPAAKAKVADKPKTTDKVKAEEKPKPSGKKKSAKKNSSSGE